MEGCKRCQGGPKSDFPGNLGSALPHSKVIGMSGRVQNQITDPDFHLSILLLTNKIPFGARDSSKLLWKMSGQREGQRDGP